VRVRALVESAGTLAGVSRSYVGMEKPVSSATLAIGAARTGRMLALVEIDGDRSRLWVSDGC
jgi:hypothetical protein